MNIEMFSKSMAEGFALIASLAALDPSKDGFSLVLGEDCSPYTLTSKPILEAKNLEGGSVYRITFTGRADKVLDANGADDSLNEGDQFDYQPDPLSAERRFRFEMHVNEKTQDTTQILLSGTLNLDTGRWSWQEASYFPLAYRKYQWAKEAA